MNLRVLFAIFKRNFTSYFANPTGYVFICGFVLVSGFAAFWPHEFFNANLANLDQLNKYLPFIMLGFVPAITMSMWADERRQGTDELLLTLPASDFDVVLGKYKAAVAIFTVSLLFSAASNIFVLARLGSPDGGLLATTYLGYWFVGVAMLSVGMVASFLTSNLTVGFVLGVAFNAPLVFAAHADVIFSEGAAAQAVRAWSIGAMLADFTRGVISLASIAYFVAIAVVGLYLSMILIGRRHWSTGKGAHRRENQSGESMLLHFIVRGLCVVIIAVGISYVFRIHDTRVDASSEKLSSLSPKSVELLSALGDRRMTIEAFVSPESKVPESYIQTRLNLLNTLNEIEKQSGGKVDVQVYETERHKPEKITAEQRYNIVPRTVYTQDRGQIQQYDIWLGVAINSGLDKKVIPFFDKGVPTEYELIGAIVSLTKEKSRKTIGVVKTDAQLMGAGNPMMMMHGGPQGEQIITELRKQYEVLEVDPSAPIERKYDALLVVQPSSLEQPQLDNLIEAVRRGVPTAIFEDPSPLLAYGNGRTPPPPGTLEPRRPQQMDPMMMRMGMQPQMPGPKGRIADLWDAIGAELPVRKKTVIGDDDKPKQVDVMDIVWQDFNPFPRASTLDDEIVFIGKAGGDLAEDDEITRGLQFVMFPFGGVIVPKEGSKLSFKPLARTGATAGVVDTEDLFEDSPMGPRSLNENRRQIATDEQYVMAARITGKPAPEAASINVVLVSDLDVMATFFFGHRDQGADERMPFFFDVDNVTFVLNTIDSLAGEDAFFDIRSRRRVHRTLTAFEKSTEDARRKTAEEEAAARAAFEEKLEEIKKQGQERIEALVKERMEGDIDDRQFSIKRAAAEEQLNRVLQVEQARLERLRDEQVEKAEADLELSIRRIQNNEKRLAVFIPPILPLAIALGVFTWRRSRELEGAVRSRVR